MRVLRSMVLGVLIVGSMMTATGYAMKHDKTSHDAMKSSGEMDHSSHKAMMKQKNSHAMSRVSYQMPDVSLLDQNGRNVSLREFLTDSEPYALNFIFTTCTTICPILTASFSQMQRELGADADGLKIISVTIDPEYDTPEVLRSYANKVSAEKNWSFLTGRYDDIVTTENAFDAYTGDKMNHRPVYFFKIKGEKEWIRIDGLASGTDLAEIYSTHAQL